MISVTTLAALPVFKAFTAQELEVLIGVAAHRSFPHGGVLCREGDVASSCFILVTGELMITRDSSSGPLLLSKVGPGALIGQIALVDHRPRSATVRAVKEASALELPREVFDRLLAAASPLAHRFQEHVAVAAIRQLRAATARLAAIRQVGAKPPTAMPDAKTVTDLRGVQAMLKEWSISDVDLDEISFVAPESLPRSMGPRSGR